MKLVVIYDPDLGEKVADSESMNYAHNKIGDYFLKLKSTVSNPDQQNYAVRVANYEVRVANIQVIIAFATWVERGIISRDSIEFK